MIKKEEIEKIFWLVKQYFEDDNLLSEIEFNKVQEIKKEFKVTGSQLYSFNPDEVERIMYLQFYLLLLDDTIDALESKEVEYYKNIFDWTDSDIQSIRKRVLEGKRFFSNYIKPSNENLTEAKQSDRNIPGSIKKIVWDRDEGKCVICGSTNNLEFDHEIPFSKGGSNSTSNIRILCQSCNRKKYDNIGLTEDD